VVEAVNTLRWRRPMKPLTTAAVVATAVALSVGVRQDRRELRADRQAGRTDEVKQDRAELRGDQRELARDVRQ
jgi:hypothetical protein